MTYNSYYDRDTYNYYQSLLQNRYALTEEALLNACIGLQEHCNTDHEDMLSLKLLEQLLLAYYEKCYPTQFGGIFEPLTKTIWYTHCLYLEPNKFGTFNQNKFRQKFNMYTNAVEDVPAMLQPKSIGEMLHVLHLICYLKNSYYDKHIAPLTFNNNDHLIGCFFALRHDRLYIMRDYDENDMNNNQLRSNAFPACDIILEDRSKYPTISQNKQLFIDNLNTRWNEAMQEILYTEFKLPEFRGYLKQHPHTIFVGKHSEYLKNEFSNIHFTRWIMHLQEQTGRARDQCIDQFQQYVTEYINQSDVFDDVHFISNARIGHHDQAFSTYYGLLRTLIKQKYTSVFDYSPDQYTTALPHPDQILQTLSTSLQQEPWKRILFALGLHGQMDGSATYEGWAFQKSHFETLFSLARTYSTLQLLLMSCRSAKKTNKISGNIIMNSSDQVSYVTYTNYFTESLARGDTLYQAQMYAMSNYHQSLLPTSYINQQGQCIELCPLTRDFHGKPAGL